MGQLVLVEHDNIAVKSATLNTVSAAAQLSDETTALVIGYQCESVAKEVAAIAGVKQVCWIDAEIFQHPLAETFADVVSQVAKDYQAILAPATTFGKNILPRLAALLDTAMVSDVIEIINENTFKRPIFAGNAIATVEVHDALKLMTIRSTAFAKAEESHELAPIEQLALTSENKSSQFVKQEFSQSERPELSSARVVISGGRALQSAENFKLIEQLADRLQGAVGASRAAVDAGYVPNDCQVGQTGKVVAPDLYIAIGISGAIQHLAGMKDSKVIVAINKDEEAPIFSIADYSLVGDLFQIIPELMNELNKILD